jgi:hypothetical protein
MEEDSKSFCPALVLEGRFFVGFLAVAKKPNSSK